MTPDRIKTGGRQAGTLNKRTQLLNEMGITKFRDLELKVLNVWIDALDDDRAEIRLIASRELSKYIFSTCNFEHRIKLMTGEKQDESILENWNL